MIARPTTMLRTSHRADERAPGSIADVFYALALNLRENWLPPELQPRHRREARLSVAKILKAEWLERTPEAELNPVKSLADECRVLWQLQNTRMVPPLLGMGMVHLASLPPSGVPRAGQVDIHMCANPTEFTRDAETAAVERWLPFLLLGNIPYEWSLLNLFTSEEERVGFQGELPFEETIEVILQLLRFLDMCRTEWDVCHGDLKLEHVAWREGRLFVIDWNWVKFMSEGHDPGQIDLDRRRIFDRVVYPLLTGKTAGAEARRPRAIFKRGEVGDTFTDGPNYDLPFHGVERDLDPKLRRWLGRGFARRSDAGGFHSLGEAADALEEWRAREWQGHPERMRFAALDRRALHLELELQRLIEDSEQVEVHEDPMLNAQVHQLKTALKRFKLGRPHVLTFAGDAGQPGTDNN